MSSLQEIKAEFIRIYEDIVRMRGLPTILGRIIAVFFLEGRELSHKEISTLTGYSISSVSRTLDQMVRMGIVHKHKDASLKHFVYHMNIDFRELLVTGLERWIRASEAPKEDIKNLTRKVSALKSKGEEQAEIDRLQAMLKNLEKTMEFLQEITKNITKELRAHTI